MGDADRTSYSGNAILVNGDSVTWFAHTQRVANIASDVTKYIDDSDACKDGLKI